MNDHITRALGEAMLLFAYAILPPLGLVLLAGLAVGLLQAMTQVQDQTLPQFIKIIVVFGSFLVMGPLLLIPVVMFGERILSEFPYVIP
ncbi:MAG: flagellar biosynthetic protein FliQ [Roseinatronobacter sp.]